MHDQYFVTRSNTNPYGMFTSFDQNYILNFYICREIQEACVEFCIDDISEQSNPRNRTSYRLK